MTVKKYPEIFQFQKEKVMSIQYQGINNLNICLEFAGLDNDKTTLTNDYSFIIPQKDRLGIFCNVDEYLVKQFSTDTISVYNKNIFNKIFQKINSSSVEDSIKKFFEMNYSSRKKHEKEFYKLMKERLAGQLYIHGS